jgi:hypothetical protein
VELKDACFRKTDGFQVSLLEGHKALQQYNLRKSSDEAIKKIYEMNNRTY